MGRQEAREALAALFSGQGFTVVNTFLPTTMNGASKVLNIYGRRSRTDHISAGNIHNLYTLNLDVLVLRNGAAADENDLDDLHDAVVSVCTNSANIITANWGHLELDEDTEPGFVRDEGKQYRLERHKVFLNVPG